MKSGRRWCGGSLRASFAVVSAAVFLLGWAVTGYGQGSLRTLTGDVTDRSKEPLRGAIVEVQNESTLAVVSYITDAKGNFSFKRLNGETDYKVWATYRGKRSKTRELSHFDSNLHPDFHLAIELD